MRAILALLLVGLGCFVRCLPLERLCPADQFEYNGSRMNAIHRVQINVSIEPVSHFAVDTSNNCLNYNWKNLTLKSQTEEVEDDYNRLLIRVYSEQFLNSKGLNSSALAREIEQIEKMIKQLEEIIGLEDGSAPACLRGGLIPSMRKAIELIKHLASLYDQQLPQTDEQGLWLGKGAIFFKFRRELDRITKELTESQAMAFQFDLLKDIYKKRIVRIGQFVFNKKSKIFFDFDSSGSITFELIFPFEDTELPFGNVTREYFDVASNCVTLADLPEFFSAQRAFVKMPVDPPTTQALDQPTEQTTPASMN